MLDLDLQIAGEFSSIPQFEQFEKWVVAVLEDESITRDIELTIRLVENTESQSLNAQYRGKDKPTNVLSFPFEGPAGIELPLLGDLIISVEVVKQEAIAQDKPLEAHWAHMVIHGCLHLLGYDHIEEHEAEQMEQKERDILACFSIVDPYLHDEL